MLTADIKEGDTVAVKGLRHSARCPHMVVMNVKNGRATTFWFNKRLNLKIAVFTLTELEKVDLS